MLNDRKTGGRQCNETNSMPTKLHRHIALQLSNANRVIEIEGETPDSNRRKCIIARDLSYF